jgi:hypothetical protein
MSKTVPVADAYGEHLQNVVAMAAASFDRSLAEYRRLVITMAEHAGELPQEEAAQLIKVCETLGIPPDQLGEDAAVLANASGLERMIAEAQNRNASKRAPLPALEAAWRDAQEQWIKISDECQQRMRAAEADVHAKRRAYEKVLNTRDESTAAMETELMRTRDRRPHLFGPVSREVLAKIVKAVSGRVGR